MRLIKSTPKGTQRVYDIEVADVHNFYANGVNVHNCATAGGVSIIKDDGSVVSSTSNASYSIKRIDIKPTGELFHQQGNGYNEGVCYNFPFTRISGVDLGTYANNSTFWYASAGVGNSSNYLGNSAVAPTAINAPTSSSLNIGDNRGLTIVSVNNSSLNNGIVAYATSSYNTGWMHGDIKGAWLSDTSTASVTGTELHPNGNWDFASSNVSYISNTASGTATVVSGQLQLSGGTSNYSDHIISIATVVGKQYAITIDYVTAVAGQQIGIYHQNTNVYLTAGDGLGIAARSSGTKLNWHFTAVSTSTGLDLVTTGTTANIHVFDNWSIRLAEPDRSVNNKGLAVYGTLTKTAVATGSNLVAYGGWSSSNYLFQPYNSALDFGTSSFSVMGWFKTSSTTLQRVIQRDSFPTAQNFRILTTNNNITWNVDDNSTDRGLTSTFAAANSGNWVYFVGTYSNGTLQLFVNGIFDSSTTGTALGSISNSNAFLTIAIDENRANQPFLGSIALCRISGSIPSPTQILKIYNDEKVLFQENSQCTLYGASDAVTALAYDDSNSLLSVGTSSGRSDFRGLARINNTTTAVTTAISASNGLIVEQ
jgi:hypothetical protein